MHALAQARDVERGKPCELQHLDRADRTELVATFTEIHDTLRRDASARAAVMYGSPSTSINAVVGSSVAKRVQPRRGVYIAVVPSDSQATDSAGESL